MTLEEAITKCLIGEEHLDQAEYEQVGKWLEELNEVKQELNEVKQELNKVSQELKVYKKAYDLVCNSLCNHLCCNWGYEDVCKACQSDVESMKTESCADRIKKHYLQKARKENDS